MGSISWIYNLVAITACFLSIAQGNIFGRGRKAIYSYSADVRAGTVDPADFASQFGLRGTLTIQSNSDGSSATFKLSNITMQAYNGPLSLDDQPESKFVQAPPDSAILEEPFEVIYRDGLVQTIFSKDDEMESAWALNIKKSIATIFQLDLKTLNFEKSNSFISEEKSIYGKKLTENIMLVKQSGHATLRKILAPHHAPSNENVYYKWKNLDGLQCSHQFQNTLDAPTERSYEIIKPGDRIVIASAKSNGKVTFSPYSEGGFSQYIQVKQEFQLIVQTKMDDAYQSNSGREHNPICIYASFNEKQGTSQSAAGEKNQPKKDNLIQIVHKQLQKLLDTLEEVKVGGLDDKDGFMEKQSDQNHFAPFWLMKTLGYADYESLKNCFSTIGGGTSYKEETIRELFLDILSQVGTKASISLLTDLIISQSLKDDSAVQALKTIPFYARQIDENLLKKYESVLGIDYNDNVKRAATLSFATLVNRACKNDKCPAEVLEKYVLKYFELFKDATEYQWKMNYLEGLSNIEVGKVVEYLEPIIKGDQAYSHHIRFLAMWATRLQSIQDPKRVLEVYWPILEDKSQHLELRVGAFVILLLSKPLQDRFNSIASIMAEEPEGSHLYYFFYSTMQSLAATKHPCYQIMKKPAQKVLQFARTPKTLLWTGNHISDYVDPDNHFGGLLQLFLVANPNTGGPNVIYFLHNDHFLGQSHNMFAIYIKIRGIRSSNLELQAFDGNDKLEKLRQLLSSFSIDERREKDDPVHVELIVQFQDRAIMTHYYNETNYSEMFSTLETMSAGFGSDFHINYQRLLFPLIDEVTGPTDLGVPMALRIPIPFMFSLRGNFTLFTADLKLVRKVQIDMKYWRNGGAFLAVYNPIGKLWHGVSRLHRTLIHLPVNHQTSLDVIQKKVEVAVSQLDDSVPGIAIHAGSNVFVEPLLSTEDSIPKGLFASCPSCLSHHPVQGLKHHQKLESGNLELENLGINVIFRYFDCDVPNIQFYLESLLQELQDEGTLYVSKRFSADDPGILIPLRLYNYLMYFPISGRCGFILKYSPAASTKGVVISAQLTSDDSRNKEKERVTSEFSIPEKFNVDGSILKETSSGELVPAYDYSLNYLMSRDALDYNVKIKFSESENKKIRLKMCFDAEYHYPDPPIDPLKQRDPKEEEVTMAMNAVIGEVASNRCPKRGVTLKISGRATPVPEKSQPFYAECSADGHLEEWIPEISHFLPYTPACVKAAVDSTALRKFEMSVEGTDLMKNLAAKSIYAWKVWEGTDPWGDYIVSSNYSSEEYPLLKGDNGYAVQFAPDGILLVDEIEEGERERSVFNIGATSELSSRFSVESNTEEDLLERKCVLTARSVRSLHENNFSHQMSSCYTLAFGHCHISSPLFAGLVREIEGTNLMALKFYNLGHYVEVVPHRDYTTEIIVDGENINFNKENGFKLEDDGKKIFSIFSPELHCLLAVVILMTCPYFHVWVGSASAGDSFAPIPGSVFRIWQRQSKKEIDGPLYLSILAETTDLMLEYTGGRVVATVGNSFLGNICGLCNRFNASESPSRWENCDQQ